MSRVHDLVLSDEWLGVMVQRSGMRDSARGWST